MGKKKLSYRRVSAFDTALEQVFYAAAPIIAKELSKFITQLATPEAPQKRRKQAKEGDYIDFQEL